MKVSVVPCASYDRADVDRALAECLAPFGGLDRFLPGQTVAIKANLVAFMKPDAAATTHPSLLCALTEELVKKGVRVIVGDSPGGLYTKPYVDRIYAVTGMKDAEAAGAELNRDFSVKNAVFADGARAKEFTYTGWLDQADHIINFCKLKTHGMMSLSAAVKNLFGCIPGTTKPEYHYRFPEPAQFADMLVDLNEYFKPTLCITDGIVGMEGNGPTAGTPRKIGVLLASESPYASDLIAARLIGLPEEQVPTLVAARKRGLLEEPEVIGSWEDKVVEDYEKVTAVRSLRFNKDSEKFFGKLASRAFDRFLASRPKVYKKDCIGCGECKRVCPAKAIVIKDGKPVIDRKECIRCFCCQEFCPKGAMKVQRTAIARLLVRDVK